MINIWSRNERGGETNGCLLQLIHQHESWFMIIAENDVELWKIISSKSQWRDFFSSFNCQTQCMWKSRLNFCYSWKSLNVLSLCCSLSCFLKCCSYQCSGSFVVVWLWLGQGIMVVVSGKKCVFNTFKKLKILVFTALPRWCIMRQQSWVWVWLLSHQVRRALPPPGLPSLMRNTWDVGIRKVYKGERIHFRVLSFCSAAADVRPADQTCRGFVCFFPSLLALGFLGNFPSMFRLLGL